MKLHYFTLSVILPLGVVLISGCTQYGEQQTRPTEAIPITGNTVEITSSGFSPSTATINLGDTVMFVNRNSRPHWPASDVHPTHTVYPGSGIGRCGTADEPNIFDACKGLIQDETFTFTFDQKGTWKYHDHLNPSLTGTIVVQ